MHALHCSPLQDLGYSSHISVLLIWKLFQFSIGDTPGRNWAEDQKSQIFLREKLPVEIEEEIVDEIDEDNVIAALQTLYGAQLSQVGGVEVEEEKSSEDRVDCGYMENA